MLCDTTYVVVWHCISCCMTPHMLLDGTTYVIIWHCCTKINYKLWRTCWIIVQTVRMQHEYTVAIFSGIHVGVLLCIHFVRTETNSMVTKWYQCYCVCYVVQCHRASTYLFSGTTLLYIWSVNKFDNTTACPHAFCILSIICLFLLLIKFIYLY